MNPLGAKAISQRPPLLGNLPEAPVVCSAQVVPPLVVRKTCPEEAAGEPAPTRMRWLLVGSNLMSVGGFEQMSGAVQEVPPLVLFQTMLPNEAAAQRVLAVLGWWVIRLTYS